MNKQRRADIAKAIGMIQDAESVIEQVANDEREYFDNMNENFKNGDKGQAADEAASALENAKDLCNDIVTSLEEASGS